MSAILDRFGVKPDSLEQQFGAVSSGRTLIMDGDGACYAATFDAKKIETAVRRFQTAIYEKMYLTKCDVARVHITPSGCLKNNRELYLGVKPYQGNRVNKEKPVLLEFLRNIAHDQFLEHENITVLPQRVIEADDAMMQDAYSIPNTIGYSEDKDLTIMPIPLYNIKTGQIMHLPPGTRYGWIKLDYSTSTTKVVGHGTKFFWAQMLMGDGADNIKGLEKLNGKLCGAVGTHAYLDAAGTEDDAANLVLDGYRAHGQNFLPEAECLWLTRMDGDTAAGYIASLNLSAQNREFLTQCFNQKYKMTEDEHKAWDEIMNKCKSVKEVQMKWLHFKKEVA